MLVFLLGVSLAAELCNGVDDDGDGRVDEPAYGETPTGCRTVFHDDDCDGVGRPGGATLCACPRWLADPANALPGRPDVVFDGACWAHADADCARPDHVGTTTVDGERVDGRDTDCDGWILLAELDCDGDGGFPTTWTGPVHTPADLDLAPCGRAGTVVSLACDPALDAVCGDDGLFWVAAAHRPTTALPPIPLCAAYGDCDDTCPLRCDGALEVCDGVDNDCAGAAFYRDLDGIPDAMQPPVQPFGLVAAREIDGDGDGVTDGCTAGLVTQTPTIPAPPACAPLEPALPAGPGGDTAAPPPPGCATVNTPFPWWVLLLGARRRR